MDALSLSISLILLSRFKRALMALLKLWQSQVPSETSAKPSYIEKFPFSCAKQQSISAKVRRIDKKAIYLLCGSNLL